MFDDARARKPDERAGFRDVQVAEHREAGRDSAGGGIRQNRNIRQLFVVEPGQRGRNFGELHQTHCALHHARAAGTRDGDKRLARFNGQLDAARDFFAHYRAHRAADKAEFHRAHHHRSSIELALCRYDGVIHAEFFPRFLEPLRVRLGVHELERISGGHARVVLGPTAIEQRFQPLARAHFEMKLALGADVQIRLKVFAKDDRAARFAFYP